MSESVSSVQHKVILKLLENIETLQKENEKLSKRKTSNLVKKLDELQKENLSLKETQDNCLTKLESVKISDDTTLNTLCKNILNILQEKSTTIVEPDEQKNNVQENIKSIENENPKIDKSERLNDPFYNSNLYNRIINNKYKNSNGMHYDGKNYDKILYEDNDIVVTSVYMSDTGNVYEINDPPKQNINETKNTSNKNINETKNTSNKIDLHKQLKSLGVNNLALTTATVPLYLLLLNSILNGEELSESKIESVISETNNSEINKEEIKSTEYDSDMNNDSESSLLTYDGYENSSSSYSSSSSSNDYSDSNNSSSSSSFDSCSSYDSSSSFDSGSSD